MNATVGETAVPASGVRRVIVVWCPDWPVVAAGIAAGLPPHAPAAVLAAHRVVACSASARSQGVRRGARRREAQARCPDLVVFDDDPSRDVRSFEPVVAAVEELAPGVEVIRPGTVALLAQGPLGYFGDPEKTAERLIDQVATRTGVECQVGIADGLFAAILAAQRGVIVPAGMSPEFLAPLDIGELDQPAERRVGHSPRAELIDLLRRLGLRTLGAFAALPERDVASRFGGEAVLAHRQARGLATRPLDRRSPPPDLVVTQVLDPPAERVDTAAFAAKAAAQLLYERLVAHGLACTRLSIQMETEHGDRHGRVWRCAEPLSFPGIADRVRWQLDGWLRSAGGVAQPSSGLSLLRLEPVEVVDGRALQLRLWSGVDDSGIEAERAGRALVRVQGLLGPDGVFTAVLGGGRGPGDQVRLVPWGDERELLSRVDPPWPGRLPRPSPATVPANPRLVEVLDVSGVEVGVTGRHQLTAAPYSIGLDRGCSRPVRGWSGPWPVIERWWEPEGSRRLARLQVVLAEDGEEPSDTALLLLRESGRWLVEGIYD